MIIRHVDASGQHVEADLFGTLAALARDEVASFPALRPHQRQPWHAFLVQVGALALHRAERADLPREAEEWRSLLLALTPDQPGGEAWALVVEDWSKPALLQPPLTRPEEGADYRGRVETPDALDMLVTSKNHDLKAGRMAGARDDDWLFALLTLQTYEGFMGAGNFGISRMNGGFGSRVAFGIRPEGRLGAQVARDVHRLLAARAAILAGYPALGESGPALLWLQPWDGASSRSFAGLDPFYVEVCRRVRLGGPRGARIARVAGSRAARIEAKDLAGRTGDPWAPVLKDGTKSYGPTGAGFGYRQMARLMRPDEVARPPLGDIAPDEAAGDLTILATAVVRGQGKTEGFHERRISVPRRARVARRGLARVDDPVLDRAGGVAETRALDAGKMAYLLKRALFAVLMGGTAKVRLDDASTDRKATSWLRLFDQRVDATFFDDCFWDDVAGTTPTPRKEWRERLRRIAEGVLDEAVEAAPRSEVKRIRAEAQARNLFDGLAGAFVREVADA